ncbi:MAG: patatin-like phospholipase family protein [Mobilicoccus sp.]|nr:patatin-like phospholipase family protein [Mobilicoccus sp.]
MSSSQPHPVIELIHRRLAAGSRPGERSDDARLAVAIEGGSARAAYGGGMVWELETRGVLPALDAVYGASAGALNAAWLVSGRVASGVRGWWEPQITNGVISLRRALRGGAVVDSDHLVDHVYEHDTLMGYEEILASAVEFHPLATDAATGESTDLAPLLREKADVQAALRATTRMPVLGGPPVTIDGHAYIDAGISEPVPAFTALAQGATHVLVLRTRSPELPRRPVSRLERDLVGRWMRRHAPGALAAWERREEHRREGERLLADDPRILQIAPPVDAPAISRVGRSEATLRGAVAIGRRVTAAAFD